jgi:hypothetical protein
MTVDWQNTAEISGRHYNGVIPFLTFAALGAYLAARQQVVSNTTVVTLPITPGTTTTAGSTSYQHTTQQNNSNLPFGLALLGTSLSQLGSGSLGGINMAPMLKYAAADVATQLADQLRRQWYQNRSGASGEQGATINQVFDFSKWGPLPGKPFTSTPR